MNNNDVKFSVTIRDELTGAINLRYTQNNYQLIVTVGDLEAHAVIWNMLLQGFVLDITLCVESPSADLVEVLQLAKNLKVPIRNRTKSNSEATQILRWHVRAPYS